MSVFVVVFCAVCGEKQGMIQQSLVKMFCAWHNDLFFLPFTLVSFL